MKLIMHFVPGADAGDSFGSGLLEIAGELRERPDAIGIAVNSMLRLPEDVFGPATPYGGALELVAEDLGPEALTPLVSGLAARMSGFSSPELSTLLIGEDILFKGTAHSPIRYQYLMRRNGNFDHAGYLKRYREIHSQIGLKTPGVLGYTQLHVDLEASERLAGEAGMGVWDVDSVSSLHLESVESFFAAIAGSSVPREAAEDEEVFVDRPRSFDFASRMEWDERAHN